MVTIFQDNNGTRQVFGNSKDGPIHVRNTGHNAYFERIFCLIETQWADERNRLVVESIKYITTVKFNFNFND